MKTITRKIWNRAGKQENNPDASNTDLGCDFPFQLPLVGSKTNRDINMPAEQYFSLSEYGFQMPHYFNR